MNHRYVDGKCKRCLKTPAEIRVNRYSQRRSKCPGFAGVPTLRDCPRCMGDHVERIEWKFLTHPMRVPEKVFTHWAPCPANGEPILMEMEALAPVLAIPDNLAPSPDANSGK